MIAAAAARAYANLAPAASLAVSNSVPPDHRAGRHTRQPSGRLVFIPAPLPFAIRYDDELRSLIATADQALAQLDAAARAATPAARDRLIRLYAEWVAIGPDAAEITINYTRAMRYGFKAIQRGPISIALLAQLNWLVLRHPGRPPLSGTPGAIRPGWMSIWPLDSHGNPDYSATPLYNAPPVEEIPAALDNLEAFIQAPADDRIPAVVRAALIFIQFVSIHPFTDGHSRTARLLVPLYLCRAGVLSWPGLDLGIYLKLDLKTGGYRKHRAAVWTRGDIEQWIAYFLRGVIAAADGTRLTLEAAGLEGSP